MEGAGRPSCTGATVPDRTGTAGQGSAARTCSSSLRPQPVGSRLPGCCSRGETHFADEIVEVSEAPLASPHAGQLDLGPSRPPLFATVMHTQRNCFSVTGIPPHSYSDDLRIKYLKNNEWEGLNVGWHFEACREVFRSDSLDF